MDESVTLEEVLDLVQQLSPADKQRLVELITTESLPRAVGSQATPRKSLRGVWRGLDITEEDLAEVRREMWGNFPRDDV